MLPLSVRLSLGLSCCLVTSLAGAQTKNPLLKAVEWQPSKVTPTEFATKLDSTLSSLKGKYFETMEAGVTPLMKSGQALGRNSIADQKKFRLEYAVLPTPKTSGTKETVIANGGVFTTFSAQGIKKLKPIATRNALGSPTISDWVSNFQKYIFAGIGTSQKPFAQLLSVATKSGLKASVTQLTGKDETGFHSQIRLRFERSDVEAKKLGEYRWEVVVTEKNWLPVAINSIQKSPKGEKWRIQWIARWMTKTSFNDKEVFAFPADAKK